MIRTILGMAIAAMVAMPGGAAAQTNPNSPNAAEAALANGYLRDQNERLAAQEAPSGASFTVRASAALARKDYAGALAILRPYKMEQPLAYRYLAGVAYAGLGDADAARKQLSAAMKFRADALRAQVALGEMEGRIGDLAAANAILADLRTQQGTCAGACRDAAELADGVARVSAAILQRAG
ncbi:hypothetical protein ACOYW6_09175 [Parablastomonas sp. CN1-191]|uniref:hypothetical protein n=1 Tax=Parablastomonas sp. CN1-191 TaxID=3400908 RepID=UPI003BF81199